MNYKTYGKCVCYICQKEFVKLSPKSLLCGTDCRDEARRIRERKKNGFRAKTVMGSTKACIICKKDYNVKSPMQKTCASSECTKKLATINKAARVGNMNTKEVTGIRTDIPWGISEKLDPWNDYEPYRLIVGEYSLADLCPLG